MTKNSGSVALAFSMGSVQDSLPYIFALERLPAGLLDHADFAIRFFPALESALGVGQETTTQLPLPGS